jgi:hypothetical protein
MLFVYDPDGTPIESSNFPATRRYHRADVENRRPQVYVHIDRPRFSPAWG